MIIIWDILYNILDYSVRHLIFVGACKAASGEGEEEVWEAPREKEREEIEEREAVVGSCPGEGFWGSQIGSQSG